MRTTGKGVVRALLLLQLALVAWPIVHWRGGVIDTEATAFVEAYLDHRPFLAQVFDPSRDDFDNYQARELSYAADWVDAHGLARLVHAGIVLLVPVSALAGGLALVAVFPRAAARAFPAGSPVTAGLCLLAFMSQFVWLASAGLFYRSGKILLLPVVLALAARLVDAVHRGEPSAPAERWRYAAFLAVLGLVAALLDRQGFFEVVLAACLALAGCLLGRRLRLTFAVLAAVAALAVLYDLVLAPAAVQALNGYRPSFEYQALDLRAFLAKPQRFAQAADVAGTYATVLLGGLPPAVVVAGAVLVVAAWIGRPGPRRPRLAAVAAVLAVAAGHWLMLALMIHRHKPLFLMLDHRLCYYPVVFQALGILSLAGLASLARGLWGRPAAVATHAALAAIVVLNVAAWPLLQPRMDPWFNGQVAESERLKASLRSGHKDPALGPFHGRLFDVLTADPRGR